LTFTHPTLSPLALGRGEQFHGIWERLREAKHVVVRLVEQMAKHSLAFDERSPSQEYRDRSSAISPTARALTPKAPRNLSGDEQLLP
jgi:hypothetical protein